MITDDNNIGNIDDKIDDDENISSQGVINGNDDDKNCKMDNIEDDDDDADDINGVGENKKYTQPFWGETKMANGRWPMANGQWPMDNSQGPMAEG